MREGVESELEEDDITEAFLLRSASDDGKGGSANGWETSTRIIQPIHRAVDGDGGRIKWIMERNQKTAVV